MGLLGAASSAAGSLMVHVGANISNLQSKMGAATGVVGKAARSMIDLGTMMENAGKKATAKFTLPITVGFGAMAHSAGNFEQQMNVLDAALDATSSQSKKLSALAQQLGQDAKLPGVSAADAASSMTLLAKAGLSVKDTMAGVRGTLLLATAAQTDQATAADIAASALNAFHLKGGKATMVADLLAGSANAAQGEITDMGFALQMAATVARQGNQSIQDTVTAITMLAKAGISGSDAGTSIKTMMLRLMAPSKDAAKTLKELGIQVRDSAGNMKHMPKLVQEFSSKMKGMSSAQRDAALNTIFGTDAIRAASEVLLAGSKTYSTMNREVTKSGQAQKLAKAQTDGFNGSLDQFKSAVDGAAISFGSLLLPALTAGIHVLTSVTSAIAGLPGPVKATVIGMMTFAAAMGPVTIVAVRAIKAIVALRVAMIALQAASALGVAKAGMLASALGLISKIPVAGLAVGAAAAGIAIGALVYNALKGKSSSEKYAEALRKEAEAHRQAADAARAQKAAVDELAGASLNVQQTQLNVKSAQLALNNAIKTYGVNSDKTKQAQIDLSQATLAHRAALRQVADAQKQAVTATTKAVDAQGKSLETAKKQAEADKALAAWARRLGTDQQLIADTAKRAAQSQATYSQRLKQAESSNKSAAAQARSASEMIAKGAGKQTQATGETQKVLEKVRRQRLDAQAKVAELKSIAAAAAAATAAARGLNSALSSISGRNVSANIVINRSQREGPAVPAGGAKGNMLGGMLVSNSLESMAKAAAKVTITLAKTKEQAERILDSMRTSLGDKMSRVADFIFRAYDDRTRLGLEKIQARYKSMFDAIDSEFDSRAQAIENNRAMLTPAEAALKALQDTRQSSQLEQAVTDAQKQLQDAYRAKDRDAILTAQRNLQNALLDQQEAALRVQAETERAAADSSAETLKAALEKEIEERRTALQTQLDDEERKYETAREIQRMHLEDHLKALEASWARGKTSAAAAQKALVKLLKSYGIDYRGSGFGLGIAFAKGLEDSIGDVTKAAQKVALAVAQYLRLPETKATAATKTLSSNLLSASLSGPTARSGGSTTVIQVSGNTFLGSDVETATKLARILTPVLGRQVSVTIG